MRDLCRQSLGLVVSLLAMFAAPGSLSAQEPSPAAQDRVLLQVPSVDGESSLNLLFGAALNAAELGGDALASYWPERTISFDDDRAEVARWLRRLGSVGIHSTEAAGPDGDVLRIEVDPEQLQDAVRMVKRWTRSTAALAVGPGAPAEHYGLRWADAPDAVAHETRRVILIHGYNSSAASWQPFAEQLTADGIRHGFFSYPNDGPLADSAKLLLSELEQFAAEKPDVRVTIIAHSMGGLIARAVVEGGALPPQLVDRLVLIATPNQGSSLAYLPGGLDPVEHLVRRGVWNPASLLADCFGDGLNEARRDMKPDSLFLRELNARARNPNVRYTVILGNQGPYSATVIAQASDQLDYWSARFPELELVAPRLRLILNHPDELLAGQGDGMVSLDRGALPGVDDVLILPMSHHTYRDAEASPGRDRLWQVLRERVLGD